MTARTRSRFRVSAACGVLLAGLLLLASCGPGGGQSENRQVAYRTRIIAERGALMNGVVQYSKVGRLHVGSPYTFEVTVMGAHAVGSISPSPNRTINPGPVSIGGSTGVKLSWNGTDCTAQSPDCTPQSSERRNIVTASDRAEWTWTLTPHQTGTARVSLFITTYEQDTNNDLWESPPIEQDIQVTATPSYLINRAASWVKALITLIGASTIGGLVMVLWRRIHKPKAEGGKAATPEETSPSEPSTKTGEKAPVDPWQPPS